MGDSAALLNGGCADAYGCWVVPVVDGRGGSLAAGAVVMGELMPPKEIFLPCAEPLAGREDECEPRGEGERMVCLRVDDPERGSGGRP